MSTRPIVCLTMLAFNEDRFEAALASLRFDEAAAMLQESAQSPDSADRADRLNMARTVAEEKAQRLHSRISELARLHDHRSLLKLAEQADTAPLLALLSPSTRERSELQLASADRWAGTKREANHRRVAEADQALRALDLKLAKALLLRIESPFLAEPDQAWRDRLLLDLEARSMEFEGLGEVEQSISHEQERQRWWRRRK